MGQHAAAKNFLALNAFIAGPELGLIAFHEAHRSFTRGEPGEFMLGAWIFTAANSLMWAMVMLNGRAGRRLFSEEPSLEARQKLLRLGRERAHLGMAMLWATTGYSLGLVSALGGVASWAVEHADVLHAVGEKVVEKILDWTAGGIVFEIIRRSYKGLLTRDHIEADE